MNELEKLKKECALYYNCIIASAKECCLKSKQFGNIYGDGALDCLNKLKKMIEKK